MHGLAIFKNCQNLVNAKTNYPTKADRKSAKGFQCVHPQKGFGITMYLMRTIPDTPGRSLCTSKGWLISEIPRMECGRGV